MQGKPGDVLVIDGHRVGEAGRRAVILDTRDGGSPRYLVRWPDGHEVWIYPGSDATVERKKSSSRN